MRHQTRVVLWTLGLVGLAAAPAAAQQTKQDWSNEWYWGAHLGVLGYATATQETSWEPMVGAHWFITKRRIGLYAAFEQAFFTDDATTAVSGRVATFSEVRRLMAGLVAMPKRGVLEPYFGGGFMIAYVVNPTVDCTGCSATELESVSQALADQSTSAYAWGMAGGQMNIGNLSVFGHYMLTDAAGGLIRGSMHAVQAGMRYSFGSAKESITRR